MAGPNGSGKSTVLAAIQKHYYSGPFVNADEIEKSLRQSRSLLLSRYNLTTADDTLAAFMETAGKSWMEKAAKENSSITIQLYNNTLITGSNPNGYDAAVAADFIRRQLMSKGETFTIETVLSHPSKADFLQQALAAGYKNYLYFICTVDPQINIGRVKQRVLKGGHDVPEDRIIKRYYETLDLLSSIIPLCYRVYLFDNSTEEAGSQLIAEIDREQRLTIITEQVPWWIEEYVIDKLYR